MESRGRWVWIKPEYRVTRSIRAQHRSQLEKVVLMGANSIRVSRNARQSYCSWASLPESKFVALTVVPGTDGSRPLAKASSSYSTAYWQNPLSMSEVLLSISCRSAKHEKRGARRYTLMKYQVSCICGPSVVILQSQVCVVCTLMSVCIT